MPRSGAGAASMRATLDSERSPSVHYANWKETMLLEKQLSTLARTEKALVHGITVDQKVAFRRFQNKLQRSKIANARMWCDKEAEIELRDAGMRRLHSESHLFEDGKIDFLSKLERRPYSADIKRQTDKKHDGDNLKVSRTLSPRHHFRSLTAPEIINNQEKAGTSHTFIAPARANTKADPVAHDTEAPENNEKQSKAIVKESNDTPKPTSIEVNSTVTERDSSPESNASKEEADASPPKTEEPNELLNSELAVTPAARNSVESAAPLVINERNEHPADYPPIKNPRNRIRPGLSTFPQHQQKESDLRDRTENPLAQANVSTNQIDKPPETCDETHDATTENAEHVSVLPPPKNPRNRIRPGQSTFLSNSTPKTQLPIAPAASEMNVTETPAGSQTAPESKPQVSFLKTYLSTDEQNNKQGKKNDQKSTELPSPKIGLADEQQAQPSNEKPQRTRPIGLRASVPGKPSLFTEEKRPDFCQMRLSAMKSLDYEPRVRSFCEKIEELGESAAHCDYYAAKMQQMVAGQTKHAISEMACLKETSEEDYRRYTGNTAMACITLKSVCLEELQAGDDLYTSSFIDDLEPRGFKSDLPRQRVEETADFKE